MNIFNKLTEAFKKKSEPIVAEMSAPKIEATISIQDLPIKNIGDLRTAITAGEPYINLLNRVIIIKNDDSPKDWDVINEILTSQLNEYEYNNFGYIHNMDELEAVYKVLTNTDLPSNTPYRMITCKRCKNIFTLRYGQVVFFKKNNLVIPKYCDPCKIIRRAQYEKKSEYINKYRKQ